MYKDWLPEVIDHMQFKTHNDFIGHLYSIFEKDFKDSKNPIILDNKIVKYALKNLYVSCEKILDKNLNCKNISYNCSECPYVDKEDIFNHITCKELSKKLNIRTPGIFELQRAIRINWIRPIIENKNDSDVLYYETYRENFLKKCFWLKKEKYIVILTVDRKERLFLTSGYYHYNKEGAKGINRDYKDYIKAKKTLLK